jgi:LysM repeat protein
MGSVRQSGWRRYLPYLLLNAAVSAITVLIVLAIWGRGPRAAAPTPTPTLDTIARVASALPPPTATVPPSPTPRTYTVRRGDTLSSIARQLGLTVEALMAANGLNDPNTLNVGQVLLVPLVEGASEPEGQDSEATESPGGDSQVPLVEIRGVNGAGDLETEAVRLVNEGAVAHMSGWTLDDGQGTFYRFPEFNLHRGAVSVHTKSGTDTVIDLYWGLEEAVWTPGKLITLRDNLGEVQSTFPIPGD